MSILRRLTAAACFALACAGLAPTSAHAQFGSQPVKIIFPFAAGGSGDAVARLLAERISVVTGHVPEQGAGPGLKWQAGELVHRRNHEARQPPV